MRQPLSADGGTVPVSVVVPAFNRADLLEAALASVRAQTLQPAEVLVVDDGSDEEDVGVVAVRHGARLVRRENGGPSRARNTGLQEARSPWVAFLDADDAWLSRKLEFQWSALQRDPAFTAAITNFRFVAPSGPLDPPAFEVNCDYQAIDKRQLAPGIFELSMESAGLALARSMFVQHSGLLVRRDLALEVGGFDEGMRRAEDHEFALRLFRVARVVAVEHPLVRYRVAPGSLSKNEVAMRLCAIEIADKAFANPHRYPPGAAQVLAALRPSLVRKAAAAYVKRGDLRGARALLASIVASDRSPQTLAMYLATRFTPPALTQRHTGKILRLWRRRPWRKGREWDRVNAGMLAVTEGGE